MIFYSPRNYKRQAPPGDESLCSDFKIDPLKLLTIPINNEIQVQVDATWKPS